MSSVSLKHLFACMEHDGALVAEAVDGRLLHIDEVCSGLACGCICPGCGRRMVAKKGQRQAHHFAHYAQTDGRSCVSAGETALHKFAKHILNKQLDVLLPEMVIAERGERAVVVQSERKTFDRAILETKDDQIVPDVVLHLRDRRLIVEFKVTHACDEQKISRIRGMNVGAIEIDLSAYRDRQLDSLGDEILYNAPRTWLHNPREEAARNVLREKAKRRIEEAQRMVERIRREYRQRLPSSKAGNGLCEVTARAEGLSDLINLKVDGTGCFTTPIAEWQAAVLLSLVNTQRGTFRTHNGLATLSRRGWINPGLNGLPDDIVAAIREDGTPFNSPLKAVEEYLKQLQWRGFLRSETTEVWYMTDRLRSRIEGAREIRDRPIKRKADLHRQITNIIGALPEGETESFIFDDWWSTKLPGRSHSPSEAADFDDEYWQSLTNELENVATEVRFSPVKKLDLMGLPYEGALARELEQKRLEKERRERAKQDRLAADRAERVANLRDRANRHLGDGADAWLNSPNPEMEGRSPIDAASASDVEYRNATYALDSRHREILAEAQTREAKAQLIASLLTIAQSRYYEPDRASLWMRSKRPELGGKSPAEFVIDHATLDRCIELLPKKRSHR